MEIFASGAWRQIQRGEAYIGGAWRRLTRAEAYIGGQWRPVARFVQPLTVTVIPASTAGYFSSRRPTTAAITTGSVTATPTGGLGPYTYAWSSGNTPTQATTTFTRTLAGNTDLSITFTVTVTDSLGATATGSVDAYFLNESDGLG